MATRQKADSHTYRCGSVLLYQDDLEELLNALEGAEKVEIKDDEYLFESLEDVKRVRGEEVRYLTIRTTTPYLNFELGRSQNSIYTDDAKLFLTAKNILERNRRVLSRMFDWRYMVSFVLVVLQVFVSIPLAIFLFAPTISSPFEIEDVRKAGVYVVVSVILCLGLSVAFGETKLNSINLKPRHESPSFLRRNRDDIGKFFVYGILGWLAKTLYDYFAT